MENSKNLYHLEVEDRPREKLWVKGAACLEDVELLAVILGKGIKNRDVLSLSHEIIALLKIQKPSLADLLKIRGIGRSKAAQILASLELSQRFLEGSLKIKITSAKDVLPELVHLKSATQEQFVVITLDSSNRVINTHTITKGLVNSSLVHPRETFYPAIMDKAVSLILAHNHPSGSRVVSEADIKVTEKLVSVSKTMGIPILDHLIVTHQGLVSIREEFPYLF